MFQKEATQFFLSSDLLSVHFGLAIFNGIHIFCVLSRYIVAMSKKPNIDTDPHIERKRVPPLGKESLHRASEAKDLFVIYIYFMESYCQCSSSNLGTAVQTFQGYDMYIALF